MKKKPRAAPTDSEGSDVHVGGSSAQAKQKGNSERQTKASWVDNLLSVISQPLYHAGDAVKDFIGVAS
jgi:hypothetical protein